MRNALRIGLITYFIMLVCKWNSFVPFGIRENESMCPSYVEAFLISLFVYLAADRLLS